MADFEKLHAATIAAHAAGANGGASAGVVPGIQPSTTFLRGRDYQLENPQNMYSRDHSENLRHAETVITALEGAADALLFPSGMAAIAAVFRSLPDGAKVVLQSGIYWGTTKWAREFAARRNITLHEVDSSDADQLAQACAAHRPNMVFIETPSNPWLKTTDIAHAARVSHTVGAILVVDATAATPVLTRSLALGADIVMHSATKALNGHSDVLAGALATKDAQAAIWAAIKADRHDAGAVLGPFEAWLLLRGMRTLPLRMARMCQSAQALAEWLQAHPAVETVYYPGLASHTGYAVAKAQMQGGYGYLLSFLVKGDAGDALRVVGKLNLFQRATSLGGVESLVEHRHTIEPHTGIPPNLIRMSVGIEDLRDLQADLAQALA